MDPRGRLRLNIKKFVKKFQKLSRKSRITDLSKFIAEFCFLSNEHGPCAERHMKWYYDRTDGICKQFQYGGCEGNGNRFQSKEECDYRCGEVQGTFISRFLNKQVYQIFVSVDPCTMPKVVGPCNDVVKQFYYEPRTDTCEEFEYSGCVGNKNRFEDQSSCETKCRQRSRPSDVNETSPDVSTGVLPISPICLAELDVGSCNGAITAYYYDTLTKNCQAFIYSGCEGNANRFQTEEQCQRLCGRFRNQGIT